MKQLYLCNFCAIEDDLMAREIEAEGEELDRLLIVGATWDTDLMFKKV